MALVEYVDKLSVAELLREGTFFFDSAINEKHLMAPSKYLCFQPVYSTFVSETIHNMHNLVTHAELVPPASLLRLELESANSVCIFICDKLVQLLLFAHSVALIILLYTYTG